MAHTSLPSRLLLIVYRWKEEQTGIDCIFQDDWTELDEYVWNEDGAYSYTYLTTYEYDGVTLYMYNMTSQYYLDGEITQYKHSVLVLRHTVFFIETNPLIEEGAWALGESGHALGKC